MQGRRGPHNIPGQRIELDIPFTGEAELFRCQPSTHTTNPLIGQVRGASIILTWEIPHDVKRDLSSEINSLTQDIEKHLAWVRSDVETFNNALPNAAASAVNARRGRILANQQRVAALNIPVKQRADSPATYSVPIRRKAPPALPPAGSSPYEPEPVWEMSHHEHALKVIQAVAVSMERSPSAFSTMKEEHIRDHFLIELNGHFEGAATGETFNNSGKTDILLRANNRNVFIAECKFWRGSAEFNKAIDQLLGYAAWRDTKTAILVFCRDVQMTTALGGIKSVSEGHANYKRTVDWSHESGFRYIFHHPNDKNREFTLTVLAFDIPGSPES